MGHCGSPSRCLPNILVSKIFFSPSCFSTWSNSSLRSLSVSNQRQIADKVESVLGFPIDKGTVGRILRSSLVDKGTQVDQESIGESSPEQALARSSLPTGAKDEVPDVEPDEGPSGGCDAPQQFPDVGVVATWGVPEDKAAAVLQSWRMAHSEGEHYICDWTLRLIENLQAEILYAEAMAISTADWLGDRWNLEILQGAAHLAKLYRPWERSSGRKAYIREFNAFVEADQRLAESSKAEAANPSRDRSGPPTDTITATEVWLCTEFPKLFFDRYRFWRPSFVRRDLPIPTGRTTIEWQRALM